MGKITRNYIYNTIYQIVAIIVPLITSPYLARVLGATNVGIEGYIISVSQIFNTIGMIGLTNYSSREIAYVRDDVRETSKVFWELNFVRGIVFILTTTVYIVAVFNSPYKIYFLIQIIWLFAMFMDFSWFFNGLENFKITVIRNILVRIVTIFCVFIFVKKENDLIIYIFIYAVSQLVGTFSMVFQIGKNIVKVNFKELRIFRHFVPSIKVFLPQLAGVLYLQIDKVMIEKLSSDVRQVAYYNEAEKLVKAPLAVITAISTTLMPRVANEFKNFNTTNIKRYIDDSLVFSMILAWPLMMGMIGIADKTIPWFLGPGYEPAVIALIMLSLTIVPIASTSVSANQYFIALGKTRMLTISYTISAVLNVVINALLIPKYGFVGAAIGTIAAEVAALIAQFYVMNQDLKIMKNYLFSSLKYGVYSVIMCVLIIILGKNMEASIVTTFIQIIVGMAVYGALLIITRDKFIFRIINRIFKKREER